MKQTNITAFVQRKGLQVAELAEAEDGHPPTAPDVADPQAEAGPGLSPRDGLSGLRGAAVLADKKGHPEGPSLAALPGDPAAVPCPPGPMPSRVGLLPPSEGSPQHFRA